MRKFFSFCLLILVVLLLLCQYFNFILDDRFLIWVPYLGSLFRFLIKVAYLGSLFGYLNYFRSSFWYTYCDSLYGSHIWVPYLGTLLRYLIQVPYMGFLIRFFRKSVCRLCISCHLYSLSRRLEGFFLFTKSYIEGYAENLLLSQNLANFPNNAHCY